VFFQEQKLDLPVVRKAPRVHYAGVIQDEQIVLVQKNGQLGKLPMLDPLFVPVQHHHPGVLAIRQRPNRN
jgi:hypothetical protein